MAQPMDLGAAHGSNKLPRRFAEADPLGDFTLRWVLQELFMEWLPQCFTLQLLFRARCEDRWKGASAFEILYEGWCMLRPASQGRVLRELSWFDPEFCRAMLCACCVRSNPSLDEMD